jgi:formiminoglutamase
VTDAGNISTNVSLEEAHQQLREKIQGLIGENRIPFVIGGGNDQSCANAHGMLMAKKKSGVSMEHTRFGIVNVDAHLDVRPRLMPENRMHSGCPFRVILEEEMLWKLNPENKFVEFACQGAQCSKEHAEFVKSHGGELHWLGGLRVIRTFGTTPCCFA